MKNINDWTIEYKPFNLSDYAQDSIVTDEYIAQLYNIDGDNVFLLPRGEQAKSLECAEKVCKWFLQRKLNADSRVVAVGGGSIGDTVGFACSIYKRGVVRLLHVPTTLLAMADSGIGGKTAVNMCGVKNAVGSYFFNCDTLIDARFLGTLDEEQLKSGKGELFKYRMLSDDALFCDGLTRIEEEVVSCAKYKLEICKNDPFCEKERNKLNFGHTIGHAMELALNLPHGIAVANGIYYETLLARALGLCEKGYVDFWSEKVRKEFEIQPLTENILNAVLQDKKNLDGIGFVLPPRFELMRVSFDKVKNLLLK